MRYAGKRGIAMLAAMAAVSAALDARAQEPASPTPPGWSVRVTPYLWAAGLKGKVASTSLLPPSKVDASFSDIMNHFDFGMMMATEVRYQRYAMILDVMYMDLGAKESRNGPLVQQLSADLRSWTVTAAAAYRFYEDEKAITVDGFVGGRFWSQRQELKAAPLLAVKTTESWVDAIVGATLRIPVGGDFAVRGTFDVGAGGSDLTWQALGTVQYRSGRMTFEVGYRHLYDKYRNGAFLYKADMSGPIVGGGYRF